jgi:Helix-turn-helix domain
MGRLLRRERTRQGLSIEEVGSRTGLAAQQIQGLESGTVDRLPDRVHTLKALRHYADFLGLPGDTYMLVLVEHWPTGALASPVVSVHTAPAVHAGPPVPSAPPLQAEPAARTQSTGAVPPATAGAPRTSSWPVGTSPESQLVDEWGRPLTGSSPQTAGSATDVDAVFTTAQVPRIDNTGPLPVVGDWSDGERSASSLALRILIAILSIALLIGVAGIVINWTNPQWLRDLRITHGTPPISSPTRPTKVTTTTTAATFSQVGSSPGGATFAVRSTSFVVAIVPAGAASWVQATPAGSSTPTFSGVVSAGQKQEFVVHSSLVVEVGASSARVFVSVGTRLVGLYAPPAAPFIMTFHTS